MWAFLWHKFTNLGSASDGLWIEQIGIMTFISRLFERANEIFMFIKGLCARRNLLIKSCGLSEEISQSYLLRNEGEGYNLSMC